MLTSPTFLPPSLIGSSDAITVPGGFPFGSQSFFFIYVRIWSTEAFLPCMQSKIKYKPTPLSYNCFACFFSSNIIMKHTK